MNQRCGFVAVLGLPNAGKSTLVNALVGAKISIVTPKAQTTHNRIMGIYIDGDAQVVLMDTPGIFAPTRPLDKAMVKCAWGVVPDADVAAFVVDVSSKAVNASLALFKKLAQSHPRVIVVFNKIDKRPREQLLPLLEMWNGETSVEKVFMISALNDDGVQDLKSYLNSIAPSGPWQYPEDQLSDIPLKLLAAEVTREQVFYQLDQELPYHIGVITESWQVRPDGTPDIHQVIMVERDGQKGIVVGHKGARIKSIGQRARKELENILGHRVHIYLHVKVNPNWATSSEYFAEMGLNS